MIRRKLTGTGTCVSTTPGHRARRFVARFHRDGELTGVLGWNMPKQAPAAPSGARQSALSRNRRNISARCSLNRPLAESSSNPSIDSALARRGAIVL